MLIHVDFILMHAAFQQEACQPMNILFVNIAIIIIYLYTIHVNISEYYSKVGDSIHLNFQVN